MSRISSPVCRLFIPLFLLLIAGFAGNPHLRAGTIVLDFTTISTDIFGQQTGSFDHVPYGFTGLSNLQVQMAVLSAVDDHFHDYPTVSEDPNSFLPDGMELDWDFQIGTVGNAPTNGDSEYYYLKIGTGLAGSNATNQGIFGAACFACIRDSGGNGPGVSNGAIVGSVWTDHIDNIAGLASGNSQLVNLIAGTTSHEIGHTLSLGHSGAMAPNPGQSDWGVMGSGATSMPSNQRVLEREFTYDKFNQLIGAVGLRGATVPEPSTVFLIFAGSLAMGVASRRQRVA